jgi:hypothetical protein
VRKFLFAIVAAGAAFVLPAKGDLIVGYNFNNNTGNTSNVATGLSSTSLGRYYEDQYGGPSGQYAPLFGGGGGPAAYDGSNYQISYYWGDSGIIHANDDYQYFSVTVAPGYSMNVSSLSFATTTNAPSGGSMFPVVEYSANADFSNPQTMGSFIVNGPNNLWTVHTASADPIINGTGTYYFRIYNTSNLPDFYSWNLDNVDLNGSVASTPEPAGLGLLASMGSILMMSRTRRRTSI